MSDSQTVDKCDEKETSKPSLTQSINNKIPHVSRRSMRLDDDETRLYRTKRIDVRGLRFENAYKDYFHGYMMKENNDETIKILGGVIRSTKRLQELCFCLDAGGYEEVSNVGLNYLSESIRKMSGLRKIYLDFEECNDITNSGLRKLGQALKYQTSLKSLTLKFGKCDLINEEGLESLGRRLKTLKSLQHLELRFNDNHLTDWQIFYFGLNLNRLSSSLKSLTLDFSRIWGCIILNHFYKTFTSLKRISLILNRCSLTDDALKTLCKTLQTLKFLQELCLDLGENEDLSDEGVDCLCETLKDLTPLKSIALVFSGSSWHVGKVSDAGLESVGQALKHLTSLRKISLEFSRLDITDAGLLNFRQILENCTCLKSINLVFRECKQLSTAVKDEFQALQKTFSSKDQKDFKVSFELKRYL